MQVWKAWAWLTGVLGSAMLIEAFDVKTKINWLLTRVPRDFRLPPPKGCQISLGVSPDGSRDFSDAFEPYIVRLHQASQREARGFYSAASGRT